MRHGTRAGRVRPGVVAIALLALPGLAVPPLAAQAPWERNPEAGPLGITEREAVAWLAEGTPGRFRALELAEALGPRASSELRAAVIDAAWAELRGETDSPPESEELYGYLEAVCRIRDTQAIPLLVEALVHGAGAANALADLGAEAFPAVLAAVSDPGGDPYRVSRGLTALRFMLEDGSLGPGRVGRVREAVRERLSGSQVQSVVRAAMRLALAPEDPELRGIVVRIASDPAEAEALVSPYLASGMRSKDPGRWVESVRKDARLFLSGGGADIGPSRRPWLPKSSEGSSGS